MNDFESIAQEIIDKGKKIKTIALTALFTLSTISLVAKFAYALTGIEYDPFDEMFRIIVKKIRDKKKNKGEK